MIKITKSDLAAYCEGYPVKPGSDKAATRDAYFDALIACQADLDAAGITASRARLVDFMAQCGHECGMFTIREENLYYTTTAALRRAWPSRFPTAASALPYLRRPQALAEKVYGKRMGNAAHRNGGWKYRGRGIMQTTGANGYEARAERLGRPEIFTNPDIVADNARDAVLCAIDEWSQIGGNDLADAGNYKRLTQRINGGYNGMADRWAKRKIAHGVWGSAPDDQAAQMVDKRPGILEPGDEGERVKALQNRLVALGYPVGEVDGKFGRLTGDAVTLYKQHHGLNRPGLDADEVDDALMSIIDSPDAPRRPELERASDSAEDLARKGSRTMSALMWSRRVFAVLFGGSALGLADDAIPDAFKGQTVVDMLTTAKTTLAPLQGIAKWATSEPLIFYCFVGFAGLWFASRLMQWRLSDHASGANLGR